MRLDHQRYNQEYLANANGAVSNNAEAYAVRVELADVSLGDTYWRVIGVHHLTPEENQGNHHVYVEALDEHGQRVPDMGVRLRWGWEGQRPDQQITPTPFDKPANEPAANLPVFSGQKIWIEVMGHGLPSDKVVNLHTDHPDEPAATGEVWNSKHHHSFYVVFQKRRKEAGHVETGENGHHGVTPVDEVIDAPESEAGNGHHTPTHPSTATPTRVRVSEKLGIDGNAPIDAQSGAIAARFNNQHLFRDLGMGWVRLNFIIGPWSGPHDSTRRQGLTWAETYRRIIDNLKAQNVRIYGLISDEAMPHPQGQFRRPPTGDPMAHAWIQQYANHFVAIARLFKDDLTILESFNEPDDWKKTEVPGWTEEHPNYIHPEWFAAMLEAVYRAMRAPQNQDLHHIKLVSGPLQGLDVNGNAGVRYLKRTYEAGERRFQWQQRADFPFDGVGYHLYIAQNPADPTVDIAKMYNQYMDELRAAIQDSVKATRPIYISEIGWETRKVNEEKQATCMAIGMQQVLADPSVALGVWFCTEDFAEEYGLYRQGLGDHNRKRCYTTFKQLAASAEMVPAAGIGTAVTPDRVETEPDSSLSVELQPGQWLATVTATVLNVRSSPDALADNSNKIGQLIQDERVVVLGPVGEWLFVRGVAIQGFVHGRFIDPPTAPAPRSMARAVDAQSRSVTWVGAVDAPSGLRLRQAPNLESSILALLPHESQVQVIGEVGDWLQVESEVGAGYVHGEYVLRPGQKARIPADLVRAVLRTWIHFKPLLTEQAARLDIDPAVAVAVLLTESGGQAFDAESRRMIIRFENHQFWEHWGKDHAEQFNRHFDFNRTPRNGWKDHRWRANGQWLQGHIHPDGQKREWEVFEFARGLNEDAAIRSISMGAPQIMGFNHKLIGHGSPRAMFDVFQQSEEAQIDGLFRFIKGRGLDAALRSGDFLAFARGYNGPGQPEHYEGLIRRYVHVFHQEIGESEIVTSRALATASERGLEVVFHEAIPFMEGVARMPPPRADTALKNADPELYAAWSRHIQQGFQNNQTMFDQVLKGFMNPYWTTVWMYRALFSVGILSFIAAIVFAYRGTAMGSDGATGTVAIFGGLSVVTFLTYFLSRPLQALEENLQLITWLGVVYNSYWTRLAYITKEETVQEEIDAATDKTIEKIKDLIATHKELGSNRPGLR
jgi:hypothetical protein